jgi:hypothetical protein
LWGHGGQSTPSVRPRDGAEPPRPVKRDGAAKGDGARATLVQQGLECLSHRDQPPGSQIGQVGVHPVPGGEETVLGENLGARKQR